MTKLDEFHVLIDAVFFILFFFFFLFKQKKKKKKKLRADSTSLEKELMPQIHDKCSQIQKIFAQIDAIEVFILSSFFLISFFN